MSADNTTTQTPDDCRRRALELMRPFEERYECALPELVDAVEAEVRAAEERGRGEERERCARLAENPYGDEVKAIAGDEPKKVGTLIADAIRARDIN